MMRYLTATVILAVLFFVVQGYGMVLDCESICRRWQPNRSIYGMTSCGVAACLHVVGGMIAMGIVYGEP